MIDRNKIKILVYSSILDKIESKICYKIYKKLSEEETFFKYFDNFRQEYWDGVVSILFHAKNNKLTESPI